MRKIWLILAALLLACCVTAALAEDGVDLDALMSEIDAEAVIPEELKGLTDGIYFVNSWMNEAFFTTSSFKGFSRANEIINYAALGEKFGGMPTLTVSATGGAVEFSVQLEESIWNDGAVGCVTAKIVTGGQDSPAIPRSAVGVYDAMVTVTWGGLSASFPIRANVMDYTGPALTGMSGVPDTVTLKVGEPMALAAQPTPADWSWPGMSLATDWEPAELSTYSHTEAFWVNDQHWVISFDQAGTYAIETVLVARYQYNGILKPVFEVNKQLTVQVTGGTGAERIELGASSLSNTFYTGSRNSYVGWSMIMNFQQLKNVLGGEPTVSCTHTGTDVNFSVFVDQWDVSGSVDVELYWPGCEDGQPIPDRLAGEYSTVVTVQWGNLSTRLPVTAVIKPYEGPALRGVSGLPGTLELAVGEVWHIEAKPDPVDWAWPGFYLTADYAWGSGLTEDGFVVSGNADYIGDNSFDVSFRTPGEFNFFVYLYATDAEGNELTTVCHTVHVTVVDKPVPAAPLALAEREAVHELSPDGRSIFINKPTITGGTAPYTIAYNCYDADSNPVNYYYSDDARTAMSPGYNGRFNVFVVVRDSAGAQVQIDTGWQDLTGYETAPLTVAEEVAVSEISPDGRSIFINQPTVSGGTRNYTYAYNCYDADSQPVNYYYSSDPRTAMTPGYAGRFCVFVEVSDGQSSVTINTEWYELKE